MLHIFVKRMQAAACFWPCALVAVFLRSPQATSSTISTVVHVASAFDIASVGFPTTAVSFFPCCRVLETGTGRAVNAEFRSEFR